MRKKIKKGRGRYTREVRYLETLVRVEYASGDTIVLMTSHRLNADQLREAGSYIQPRFPGAQVVVLASDFKIGVIGPQAVREVARGTH